MENLSRFENEPNPQSLDKAMILDVLAEMKDEAGLDIDLSDIKELTRLVGEDDNDFLGNLMTLAIENGRDPDEFFAQLGIDLE